MAYFAGNYSRLDCFLLRGEPLVIAGAGFITGWMAFLSPNQQCRNTEGKLLQNYV